MTGRSHSTRDLETPELHALRGYLAALSDFIFGGNYEVMFEAKGFELENSAFSLAEVMRFAYPESSPDTAEVVERSPAEMIESVNECLKLPDRPFSDEWFVTLAQKQISGGFF